MPLEIDRIQPFFQAIVFEKAEGFIFDSLSREFMEKVCAQNSNWNEFEFVEHVSAGANPQIWHFEHHYAPSWYRFDKGTTPTAREIKNKEHDLLFLYENGGYLFLHSQCNALLLRGIRTVKEFSGAGGPLREVRTARLKRVVDNSSVRFSSVGIANLFNSGGSAPEAKSYHGRDADYCLTPTFDTGFAMSYFMGRDTEKISSPLGCSFSKKKVWRTWVESLTEFQNECDKVADLLNESEKEPRLRVLSQPIEIAHVESTDVIGFGMDFVTEKGFARLRIGKDSFSDWSADLDLKTNGQVRFHVVAHSGIEEFTYSFSFDKESGGFQFVSVGTEQLRIHFSDDDIEATSNPIPLSTYLSQNLGFTFLLRDGRVYKNHSFWRDNRFLVPFTSTSTDFDWKNGMVNIRAETTASKLLKRGEKDIQTFLENELLKRSPQLLINDDGGNEVADILFVNENTFILVHAKFSKTKTPGLRAEDLQVVSAQAIKNLKHFVPDLYRPRLETLFENYKKTYVRLGLPKTLSTKEELLEMIASALNDDTRAKECWIVQPGISVATLSKRPNHKMHTLLNFVLSNCSANNVRFTLYGS